MDMCGKHDGPCWTDFKQNPKSTTSPHHKGTVWYIFYFGLEKNSGPNSTQIFKLGKKNDFLHLQCLNLFNVFEKSMGKLIKILVLGQYRINKITNPNQKSNT